MKNSIKAFILILCFVLPVFAQNGFNGRPIIHNIGMPTGHILNAGEVIVGIGPIGFGVSERIQFGTNFLLFLFHNYNANAKISLFKTNDAALSVGVDVRQFYLDISGSLTSFVSTSPFLAFSKELDPKTDLHLSGYLSHISDRNKIKDAEIDGMAQGTIVSAGLSYDYSNRTKFLAETGYDMTFDGYRFGGAVLFGWKTFRLKLGLNCFDPKGGEKKFISPVIGLWWRFGGEE